MQVIICGAGQVGFHIAKYLSHQHNDVTVMDSSRTLVRKIEESLDVKALVGYASDPDLLDKADVASADMLVAVTNSDEVNMVACQVAHSLFNVPTKIARIRNQSYLNPKWQDLFSREHLPIDITISPEIADPPIPDIIISSTSENTSKSKDKSSKVLYCSKS